MKRIASLILCAIVALTSLVLFAVPASAAEAVVYVKDGGTGDGSSANAPLGSLEDAIKALATTGGTIKVVDVVTLVANATATAEVAEYFIEPAHERQITITSADPANKAKLSFPLECPWYALSGVTVFENIKLVNDTFDQFPRIIARGNHITMGEGLEMYFGEILQTPADTFDSAMKGFCVIGLANIGSEYDGYMDDTTWITIKSGVYFLIQGYTRRIVDPGELTGNAYYEFLGDFAVRQMGWANMTQTGLTVTGKAYVYWDAVVTCWRIFPGYDTAVLPFDVELVIAGGSQVDAAGLPIKFVGATKVRALNVWYDETSAEASDFAMYILGNFSISFADPDAGVYIDELKNYSGPAYRPTEDVAPLDNAPTTDAPVVTEAPATDAPATQAPVATDAPVVTTEAPAQPEDTPATGDASVMVVFAAAAVLSVAAVVVIKKKEN